MVTVIKKICNIVFKIIYLSLIVFKDETIIALADDITGAWHGGEILFNNFHVWCSWSLYFNNIMIDNYPT